MNELIKLLKEKINLCGMDAGDQGCNEDEIDDALKVLSEIIKKL